MSKRKEVNAHCQSCEGQPLLSKWRQAPQRQSQAAAEVTWVTILPLHGDRHFSRWTHSGHYTQEDSLEGGYSVPLSSTVTRRPRLSVSDLPPLHGPPLTVTPPWQLSPQLPRAASARIKLPPLPATPAASGSSPRGRAWSAGHVGSSHQDLVPPSPWGTMAADRVQETPSPDSSAEKLWRGSAARQGHRLPPLRRAGGMLLRTGIQPAWEHLEHIETEELTEVQEEHGGKTYEDSFRGLAPCQREERFTKSTCTREQSSLCQEADGEAQVMDRAPKFNKDSNTDIGNSSELLSPARLPEQQPVSDNSQGLEMSPKEPGEKWEEEELPETEIAGDRDSNPQGASLPPLNEEEAEEATSALDKDPWDEGHNEFLPMSEAEETSCFSAIPSLGRNCEEMGTHQLPKQTIHGKLMCTGPEDASDHLLNIEAQELEKLEDDILSSLDAESPSVQHSLCSWTIDCTGETENYAQLVPPILFEELWSLFNNKDAPSRDTQLDQLLAKWEEEELPDRDSEGEGDSEPESELSLPLQEEGAEPAASPLDSDPCDEGHSEPFPMVLPEDSKMSAVCASPADTDTVEEVDAAGMEAGCAQATPPQEKPCGAGVLAGACPVPAQPLVHQVPATTAGIATVPQSAPPRLWRSITKTARRALRRLFSFSCLRGQQEERAQCQHHADSQT